MHVYSGCGTVSFIGDSIYLIIKPLSLKNISLLGKKKEILYIKVYNTYYPVLKREYGTFW